MKDRLITIVSRRLALPLVVVLLGTRTVPAALPSEQQEPTTMPQATGEGSLRTLHSAFGRNDSDSPDQAPGFLPTTRLRGCPPDRPVERSWNLELIAREADTHTRRGFELAGRKACFL